MNEQILNSGKERIQINGRKLVAIGALMISVGLGISWASYDADKARSELEAIENCKEPSVPIAEGPSVSPCAQPPLSELGSGLLVLGGVLTVCTGVVAMLDKESIDE